MLFATGVRFACAYRGAFLILDTCWRDFPDLSAHLARFGRVPGVAGTVAAQDYRHHYFDDAAFSVRRAGPDGHCIVPRTPDPLLTPAALPDPPSASDG